MKKALFCQKALVVALGSLYISIAQAQSYLPHVTLEGMTGSQTYGRLDALAPLVPGCNSLFYTDLQAKYGYDDAYYVGLGLGDRVISGDKILGGYLFLDYNESQHHHDYWVVSPGVELIKACWDVRLNGYIPVNGRRTKEGSFFPSGPNECGIHGDCNFVEFTGHQQFEHRFMRIEEVGPGADLVFGKKWGCNNLFQIGPYYYHMGDSSNIIGGVARVELPLRAGVSLVGEACYDNDRHGAAVMGLQYRFNNPQSCAPLCDRLYDQVYRYRGNLGTGTGIRVKHDTKDEGLFLRRDNIFFFSEAGTAVIADPNAGTFENPFAPTEFTQANVTAIGKYTNLYMSTGTYSINPPVNSLALEAGQSIYGRSSDFKCTVNEDERPVLLGSLQIDATINNTIDSVQIKNIQTNPVSNVFGLVLENAGNLRICNTDILAEADSIGDASIGNINFAEGIDIGADQNDVVIEHSSITAIANITGNNSGINQAAAISTRSDTDASDTVFVIRNSQLNAFARVGLNNTAAAIGDIAVNMATGIGINIVNSSNVPNFLGNDFSLSNVQINTSAEIGNDNIALGSAINMAAGIGNNVVSNLNVNVAGEFRSNKFSLINTQIFSNAMIGRDNVGTGSVFNMSTGIGNNVIELADATSTVATFLSNTFLLDHATIQSIALVTRDNITTAGEDLSLAYNASAGIGNNGASLEDAGNPLFDLKQNDFVICNSVIEGIAEIVRDNSNPITAIAGGVFNAAVGIGVNNLASSSADNAAMGIVDFVNNDFTISCCKIKGTALVENNNFSGATNSGIAINTASGIGINGGANLNGLVFSTFDFNRFTIIDSQLLGIAIVTNDNTAIVANNMVSNLSAGFGVNVFGQTDGVVGQSFGFNELAAKNSEILALSQIGNNNLASSGTGTLAGAFNEAVGLGTNIAATGSDTVSGLLEANTFNVIGSRIGSEAQIGNDNAVTSGTLVGAVNLATGFGINSGTVGIEASNLEFIINNVLSFCGTSVFAAAHIGNDNFATGTTVGAFNQALGFGMNSASLGVIQPVEDNFGNLVNFNCSFISSQAIVKGDQTINGFNVATGLSNDNTGTVDENNTIAIFNSFVNVLARIDGSNSGSNLGIGLSSLGGINTFIRIFDSLVNIAALADGANEAIATQGQVIAENTVFNIQ